MSYMKETYLISDEKLNLAIDIADREQTDFVKNKL